MPAGEILNAQSPVLTELQERQREEGSDLHLISISLDTEHDQPDVLADYSDQCGARPSKCILATAANKEKLDHFARRAGARVRNQPKTDQIDHALVSLRIQNGDVQERITGLEPLKQIAR